MHDLQGGKLLSTIRKDQHPRNNSAVNSTSLPTALGIMCSLKNAKDTLWSLEARTGQQSDEDVRLLLYITDSLVQDSCLWVC